MRRLSSLPVPELADGTVVLRRPEAADAATVLAAPATRWSASSCRG
ncbi:hypothetical protein ACFQ1I_40185 [Kitasatospora arboriphila]